MIFNEGAGSGPNLLGNIPYEGFYESDDHTGTKLCAMIDLGG